MIMYAFHIHVQQNEKKNSFGNNLLYTKQQLQLQRKLTKHIIFLTQVSQRWLSVRAFAPLGRGSGFCPGLSHNEAVIPVILNAPCLALLSYLIKTICKKLANQLLYK